MGIIQRFICTRKAVPTIRRTISKSTEHFLRLPRLSVSKTPDLSEAIPTPTLNTHRDTTNKSDWTVVYRLPMVRWASAFNRLKFYQGLVTVVGVPSTFILEKAELLSAGSSSIFGAVGISGIITLALCSLVVKNLIGFIHINKEMNKLKFAYVDYWGRRQDTIVNINDVIPDGAQNSPARVNFYQKISLQSDEKINFKLLQRYGIIAQPEVFSALFY